MLIDGVTPPKELADLVEILNISGASGKRRTLPKPQDLELLTNVNELVLWHVNIGPKHVVGLTKLQSLRIDANTATDLSPLGKLTSLTSLNVNANSVSDFSNISGLKALTKFHIDTTHLPVAQISPLPQLAYLGIKARSVSDLSALAQSPALEEIMLVDMKFPIDLRPLEACESLRKIKLQNVEVSNYGRLKPLVDASAHHPAFLRYISLRLKRIDIVEGCVYQDARDVQTKGAKTFQTYFLPVAPPIWLASAIG